MGGVCFVIEIGMLVVLIVYNVGWVWLCNLFMKFLGVVMVLIGKLIVSEGLMFDVLNL